MLGNPSPRQSEVIPFHRGVRPHEGELLSCYLLRLAGGHSADPYRFYSHLLPGIQIWNRDIDRHPNGAINVLLVERCGLQPEAVEAMSLKGYTLAIEGPRQAESPDRGTWINPLGIFHRTRVLSGLQVCPICLASDGIYRRLWRLSFVTHCPIHGVPLYACCPVCRAPIVPHRQLMGTTLCHYCHTDHLATWQGWDQCRACPASQQVLLAALEGKPVPTLCDPIPISDLARGVSLLRLWGMLRTPEHARGHAIETHSAFVRWIYFDLVHELATQWPESIGRLNVKGRISRQTFERSAPPSWLNFIADQLSPIPRPRGAQRKTRLASWLKELGLIKPAGWRQKRALALLKAAAK